MSTLSGKPSPQEKIPAAPTMPGAVHCRLGTCWGGRQVTLVAVMVAV